MGILNKVWKATPASQLIKGDIKGAFRKGVDPFGLILKKKKDSMGVKTMKKGGKVKTHTPGDCCRGMGAATRGGKFGKDG